MSEGTTREAQNHPKNHPTGGLALHPFFTNSFCRDILKDMTSQRKDIFAPDQVYHVFNRSIERRPVFTNKYEYERMLDVISYYRNAHLPMRYSQFLSLPQLSRQDMRDTLEKKREQEVILYAYALMPNHFHFLLKQVTPKGVSIFLSNISNSFAKFFNIRHKRTGSLWQRPFKAVRIETEAQLLHVSRYIHLNPVSSYLIDIAALNTYPWTSLPEYLRVPGRKLCDTSVIQSYFQTIEAHQQFIRDQSDYARQLEKIKHLSIDGEEEL